MPLLTSLLALLWQQISGVCWGYLVGFGLVYKTTFNNISLISWRSVFLVEEDEVLENKTLACHQLLANFNTKSYNEYTSPWGGFELTTLVVIGTDCTGSKSNYHHHHDGKLSHLSIFRQREPHGDTSWVLNQISCFGDRIWFCMSTTICTNIG